MPLHSTDHHGRATILFTHYGDEWIRGSERCLLDLLSHIDRNRFKPVLWCNNRSMAREASKLDIPVIRSDFSLLLSWHRPHFAISDFYKLIKKGIQLVDTFNVTLIHANSGAPSQWLNFVARARHIPLLTHLHSRYPLRDRVTLGLHQVAMSVGVSQPVIKQLIKDGVPLRHCCVIPDGIDTGHLDKQPPVDLRKTLNIDDGDFLIATTGSLILRKGIDLIIDAVSQLVKQKIPAQLVIIGEGPEREKLQRQVQRLNLQNHVYLLGEQSAVAGILRGGVDLFVSAAREEAFGLVLAEASLCNLAVVAPAVGGIPDVVVDGHTAILFPAENITALTQAISQLFHTPELRKKMARAGRRHVLANFTIQRNVLQFEKLYSQLMNNPAMRMHWYSHWKLVKPIKNICKQLIVLILKKSAQRLHHEY